MIISHLKQLAGNAVVIGALGCLCAPAPAQVNAPELTATSPVWRSDRTKLLIGLPSLEEDAKGSLSLTPEALTFTSMGGATSVERARIVSITAGYERKEAGGTTGRISRAVIPFGGGSALAATATNKEVGLLTIEFRDEHNALHGAVFQMSKADAAQAQQVFGAPMSSAASHQAPVTCHADRVMQSDTLALEPLLAEGLSVPAEYRVLLYEQLLTKLRKEKTFYAVYRDGDDAARRACPQLQLQLTLLGFNKGNAALRASTGPLGFFVGATSLRMRVSLLGQNGDRLLTEEIKVSQRGDTESLDVAEKIAKSVNKRLKKQLKPQRVTPLSSGL